MLTKLKLAAALALVTCVTALAVAQQAADRPEGILKAVDTDKNTVTVMITRDKDEDVRSAVESVW